MAHAYPQTYGARLAQRHLGPVQPPAPPVADDWGLVGETLPEPRPGSAGSLTAAPFAATVDAVLDGHSTVITVQAPTWDDFQRQMSRLRVWLADQAVQAAQARMQR